MSDGYNLNLFLILTVQAGLLYLFIRSFIKPASTSAVLADPGEKNLHAKHLTVDLALIIACAGKKISVIQLKVIKNYIEKDIAPKRTSEKTACYVKVLFHYFFVTPEFNQCSLICKQIFELIDFAGRCDILDFCMRLVSVGDVVTKKQLVLLKDIAERFEFDGESFRLMLGRIIPLSKYETKDAETILGITSDMDADVTNSQLGREYIKWNARVTNSNPQIRKQAQDMLELIAKAKSTNK
jgi:hypothetical protein